MSKGEVLKNELGIALQWFERAATLLRPKSVLPVVASEDCRPVCVLSAAQGSQLIGSEERSMPCTLACDQIATEPD